MESTKKRIGLRIKELRKLRNLTQEELAEKIKIDPKTLSGIEVGRNFPSMVTLVKLTKQLKIDLSDIFDYPYVSYNIEDLRKILKNMIDEVDVKQLKILIKVVQNIIR